MMSGLAVFVFEKREFAFDVSEVINANNVNNFTVLNSMTEFTILSLIENDVFNVNV